MTLELLGMVLRVADPLVLVLLALLPALAAISIFRERRLGGGVLISSLALLPGRRRPLLPRLRPLLLALRLVALALMIVALARPQVVRASEIPTEGIDIVVVIHVSGSMSETGFGSGDLGLTVLRGTP